MGKKSTETLVFQAANAIDNLRSYASNVRSVMMNTMIAGKELPDGLTYIDLDTLDEFMVLAHNLREGGAS